MRRVGVAIALLVALGSAMWAPRPAVAATDPASCQTVRLSDIGWTDVAATTGVADVLLTRLGYRPKISVLSVPVTYAAMKNKDIDVFLGNWMPSMAHDQVPFVADGSVQVVRANLTGAKYTLAVPTYLYDAGLRDFSDIKRFRAALGGVIYGLESGNDGNRHILDIVAKNAFGLGDFKLVESSEQGMLAQVERAYAGRKPIVFLGWAPHPMNTRFAMSYLTGGDAYFGPDFGGAVIYTNARAGYLQQCPNLGRLLKNLSFTLLGESQLMGLILDAGKDPQTAAGIWLKANPGVLPVWLSGVTTFDGRPGLAAVSAPRAHATGFSVQDWLVDHKLPLGAAVTFVIAQIKQHMTPLFDAISFVAGGLVNGLTAALTWIAAPILILGIAGVAYAIRRSIALSVFVVAALLFIVNQGYWGETVETLSLVLVAALVSTILGVPIGIAAAHRPWLNNALRPVLDLMQTLPTFVYLIPTLVLFGLGVVPGLISTVIFAMPAPIRLTQMGIVSAPRALIEAGQAFGATRSQLLWKVELPAARGAIIAGVTQCIMLCLSMVVIAALVGAGGLGVPVVRALNTVQVGMGFEAGFAIVLLAIILDRMTRPAERRERS
jgi:glycine betaine/proline transport system substrate-binding protein